MSMCDGAREGDHSYVYFFARIHSYILRACIGFRLKPSFKETRAPRKGRWHESPLLSKDPTPRYCYFITDLNIFLLIHFLNGAKVTIQDIVIDFVRLGARFSYHRIGRQSYVSTMMTGALVAVVMVPALGLFIMYLRAFVKIRQAEVQFLCNSWRGTHELIRTFFWKFPILGIFQTLL